DLRRYAGVARGQRQPATRVVLWARHRHVYRNGSALLGRPDDARDEGGEDVQVGRPVLATAAARHEYHRYRWVGRAELPRRGRVQDETCRLIHIVPTHGEISDGGNAKPGKISRRSDS